jgi:CHAT domain-containing protein
LLLPESVERALLAERIDTLVVVPVSIRKPDPNIEIDAKNLSATHLDKRGTVRRLPPESRVALSVGVVPFVAFRIGGSVLLERMSIVIAPGFFSFARDPMRARQQFAVPIVVGDPENSSFAPLPGARQEAVEVAAQLKVAPFVGKQATRAVLESHLRKHSGTVEFIHLATHGVADSDNPVDESYLVFSDGRWNARQISSLREAGSQKRDLPLLKRQPLVVMSACQTALGKDFPAGTIGLARAWQWAGASNVVMSLWSVDDAATRELMTRFIDLLVAGTPVDKALQSAMLAVRERYPSPAHWASFAVFGAPERLP